MKILVVGSANMDLTLNVYKLPAAGQTLTDDGGVAYVPGGKGANAAVALHRLGAEVTLCTRLGADAHGQQLYNFYRDVGLDTSAIKADRDNPTGLAVVIKESDGQNRIIHYPGANEYLSAENISSAISAASPDAVYLGFEVSFDVALTAARIAASRGIPVFIDAAPADKNQPLEALPFVEIFSPNETETEAYTGILPMGTDTATRAAIALSRRVKCRYIVIKQGARGACIFDGRHINVVPAMRVDKVVDTTAAGDTFTAALTLEYMKKQDITAAVRYATAAAAISVSRAGASSSVPTEAEVRALLSKRGYV